MVLVIIIFFYTVLNVCQPVTEGVFIIIIIITKRIIIITKRDDHWTTVRRL